LHLVRRRRIYCAVSLMTFYEIINVVVVVSCFG
jgi:hypothetical protein